MLNHQNWVLKQWPSYLFFDQRHQKSAQHRVSDVETSFSFYSEAI
jgi:hypothetical protein